MLAERHGQISRLDKTMGTLELATVGLAGSAVGLMLGVPLIWPLPKRTAAARYLGGALVGLAAIGAIISARLVGILPPTPIVNHAINLLGLSTYPLLYLYLRAAGSSPGRARRPWALWLGAPAYLAMAVARQIATGEGAIPFSWMLPILVAFTALCTIAAVSSSGSGRAVASGSQLVPPLWLVAFLILLNAAQITRMLFASTPAIRAIVPVVVSVGFLALVARVASRAFGAGRDGLLAPAGPRYEKSAVDAAAAAALIARIDRVLREQRLFAEPALTLGRLAVAVDASPHQVSEVLNRFASTSFHELITQLRVEDVKAQLQLPEAEGYTIEGIGAAAGFGSRSALYAAFRRREGISPAQFRARAGGR
ncbi:MAG TPA: helix-turn-helix domain-containing protein [Vicinamibacterales bacterium]|nr:helix-turn-helix domain-containing protein [Vicinamibacterales bacterium]